MMGNGEHDNDNTTTTAPTLPRSNNTKMKKKKQIAAVCWTGGKDCNLALYYAQQHRSNDLDVKYLVVHVSESHGPSKAHPMSIMQAQAESLGMELLQVPIVPIKRDDDENSDDPNGYMAAYVRGATSLYQNYNIEVLITGDIELVGTMERNWMERVCEQVQTTTTTNEGDDTSGSTTMSAYLPLFGKDRMELLETLLQLDFYIIYSCVKAPFFNGSWIGRRLDRIALKEMMAMAATEFLTDDQIAAGIQPLDLCGERGEYHTMVLDGPTYQNKVELHLKGECTHEEFKTNWRGDIHNADVVYYINA
jgi:uncharacterized protein (TIGR00290 family)